MNQRLPKQLRDCSDPRHGEPTPTTMFCVSLVFFFFFFLFSLSERTNEGSTDALSCAGRVLEFVDSISRGAMDRQGAKLQKRFKTSRDAR